MLYPKYKNSFTSQHRMQFFRESVPVNKVFSYPGKNLGADSLLFYLIYQAPDLRIKPRSLIIIPILVILTTENSSSVGEINI